MRSDRLATRMRTKCAPAQRAAKYLKRIAALTGAEQVRGDSYWLRAGCRDFLVAYRFVLAYQTMASRHFFLLRRSQTCRTRK